MEPDRRTVADACRVLYEAGLTELYTGHVSARTDAGVLIPEHRHDEGRGLESIAPEYVVEVDRDGEPLDGEGAVEPPSEFPIHAGVLGARPEVASVAHAHPLHATALSAANEPVRPASLDATLFGGAVPVHDPGPTLVHDREQGEALAAALGEGSALLLRGHGAVTAGRSVAEATARMYVLERAATLQTLAGGVGGVEPFAAFDGSDGYLSESDAGFFEEVFAFLEREHL